MSLLPPVALITVWPLWPACLGSGHCLGMCGALVSGYFMNAGPTRSYLPYFVYQIRPDIRLHDGRICGGGARSRSGFQRNVR